MFDCGKATECGHRAVALGAHRALKTAKEVAEETSRHADRWENRDLFILLTLHNSS